MIIREEKREDFACIHSLLKEAFAPEAYSDHREQFLVERLRESPSYIPQLSLVAEENGTIIGYIMFTKIEIVDAQKSYPSLALAPLAVIPSRQKMGIGGALIEAGQEIAAKMGYKSVVILGHPDYYSRFAYRLCAEYGIVLPFDVPSEFCLVRELCLGGLDGVAGTVKYDSAFEG